MDTQLWGIAHLLRDSPASVPPYQRSYSWTEQQVEAFWQDLKAALVADQPVYFLGTVVVTSSSEDARLTVIDGQQRLATTSMLLAAICEQFRERGSTDLAEDLSRQYVSVRSLRSGAVEPRLLLNTRDRGAYNREVFTAGTGSVEPLDGEGIDEASDNSRIAVAMTLLRSLLSDDVASAGPRWTDRLLDWVDLLDKRARVIVVQVDDDADAFLIFEALNDRGLELAIADVIKNYLFGLARGRISEAEDFWLSSQESLELAPSADMTTYVRRRHDHLRPAMVEFP